MARTLVINGRGIDTGDWGGRFYDRLVLELGEERAREIAGRAYRVCMPRVRTLYPSAPGLHKRDVILEGFLLAVGVPEEEVPRVAGRYRRGAEIDLSSYLKQRPS